MSRKRNLLLFLFLAVGLSFAVGFQTPAQAATTDLFMSEYVEGSSLNKAIEIYNGTGASVDLDAGDYILEIYFNGNATVGNTVDLTGVVADGDVFVVADDGADTAVLDVTDQTATGNFFNGDDVVLLKKAGVVIDAFGQLEVDPGSQWPGGGQDDTLRRSADVCEGDTDPTDAFDAGVEWASFAQNTFDDLGTHTANCDGGGGTGGSALVEPFDDDSQFTASETFFSDEDVSSGFDYFGITDGAGGGDFGGDSAPGGIRSYTGFTGSYLVGMDMDGEGATLPIVIDWTGIDVSGLSSIQFSGDFAESFEDPGDIDDADLILVEYQLDGAGFVNLIQFAGADFSSSSGPFNGVFREDTDFDGTGDGTILGNAAQSFTKAISGTGSTLDLRLTVSVDSGDEDFAVDNFVISESTVVDVCSGAIAIADVQGTGAATPFDGQEVTIRGVVTADFGGEIVVQENSSDPRSGVVVFSSGNGASVGDDVCVTGVASERFDQTQVGGNDNPNATVEILSSGNPLPAPVVLTTANISDEQWEGVFVRVENVIVENPDLGFGEFSVNDGSGAAVVDDLGAITYSPVLSEALDFVQGPLFFSFGDYKIEPRDDDDIGIAPPPPEACGDPVTLISAIQGAGFDTPLLDSVVSIEGIVVGDFQDDLGTNGDLNGFFVQEEDADSDADAATSEGIFVFQGSDPAIDVHIGDQVRVTGLADEFFGMTQIDTVSFLDVCSSGNALPAATEVTLPYASEADLEAVEGMYVTFPQALVISEYFNFDRFGEMVLTTERPFQPTAIFEPGSQEASDLADLNARSRITLDDGRTASNPDPAIHPNGAEFTLDNRFRGGDLVQNATGVINYSFSLYRIQPTEGADYTAVNPRTAAPEDVGGRLTVASFNVLNYFNTIDDGTNDICGASQTLECRGADNEEERVRQLDKIVAAMADIQADVTGIIEVENTPGVEAMSDIVDGLNAIFGAGVYDYIDTGVIGTDAIKVGFIYNTITVTPSGPFAVLDDPAFVNPFGASTDRNRPALAQTFVENSTGQAFTPVVNHLKSKGSGCGEGDDDAEQGSCNLTRTVAAQALVDWIATDPTGSGDPDFLIIGDLNAYDKEDPIDVLTAAGYTDLALAFNGEFAYSFVFSGQYGYLDYALSNPSMTPQVTGATEWHINADEPDILNYDTSFKQDAQDALYEANSYRASDHDPIIVGLALNDAPLCNGEFATVYVEDGYVVGGLFDGRHYNGVLSGTRGDDVIVGTDIRDVIFGRSGDDLVCAGDGNDRILGNSGDDTMFGEDGNDRIIGGAGNDNLFGGAGFDNLIGNSGDDNLDGGADDDSCFGSAGHDTAVACEHVSSVP